MRRGKAGQLCRHDWHDGLELFVTSTTPLSPFRFEVLLSQLHPSLFAHIQVHGVPSVLYVSQWLMTLYATPFPTHFSARVIDVMLQVGPGRM